MSRVALAIDDPQRFELHLPERLDERWVLGYTLSPGPRPVLVHAEDKTYVLVPAQR